MFEVNYISGPLAGDFETKTGFATQEDAIDWAQDVLGSAEAWIVQESPFKE